MKVTAHAVHRIGLQEILHNQFEPTYPPNFTVVDNLVSKRVKPMHVLTVF